jgi:predicted nuclease with TOPRIM domain
MTFYIFNSFLSGLSEALGINELSTALDALRGAVESSLKGNGVAGTRSKAELLNANNRLTEEVTQLRQQLQELEARKVDAIAQLKDEVSFFLTKDFHSILTHALLLFFPYQKQKLSLQQQLSEQRRYDSKNPHLMHQIATLEDSLRQERERKERALTEIDGLKDRLDKLGRDVVSSLHSKTTKVQKCEGKNNLFPYTE